jgi:hypothetical protein
VGVEAMRSGVSKAYLHVLFWIVWVIMIADMLGVLVIVAMVVRVAGCMTMRVRMVPMRSIRLVG